MNASAGRPTPGATTIALVTVLFNCEKYLSLFFECLAAQTDRNFVVIVMDNASRDASLARARQLGQAHGVACEFIANSENLGIAVGNNQGIEKARQLGIEHVVLINNDIGCAADLIQSIRSHAIVPGHLAWTCAAFYGDTDSFWYAGGHLSYWLARGIHDAPKQLPKMPHEVSYAPTCLMYLHTSVFQRVGLMDARYFVYYDDTDFCRRLQIAGIPLIFDPAVSFRHYVGGSSGGDLSPFFLRISTRNKFIYIAKHYAQPWRTVVTLIALASKLVQLAFPGRRQPTLQGLREAWAEAVTGREARS